MNQEIHIGLDKLTALDRIKTMTNSKFLVTGSISLYLYGVIDREIKDIDIVVPDLVVFAAIIESYGLQNHKQLDYDEKKKIEDQKINQIRFKVNGLWCCAFESKDGEEHKAFPFSVGRSFNVAHPQGAILAKKRYVSDILKKDLPTHKQNERLKKHVQDIALYNDWQHSINPKLVGIDYLACISLKKL